MNKIIIASHNEAKIKEMKGILGECEMLTLTDIGMLEDIEETEMTYAGNAELKLLEVVKFTKGTKYEDYIIIADDSGIEFDCLDGMPGVYSQRFMSRISEQERNKFIIDVANTTHEYEAKYICNIAYKLPNENKVKHVVGESVCTVQNEMIIGRNFAYDSILKSNEVDSNENLDNIPLELKNKISHRAKAITKLKAKLQK